MMVKKFWIWIMTKSVEKGANRQALTQTWILTHKVCSLHFWGYLDCSWGLLYCLDCNKSLFHLIRSLKIVPEKLLKRKRKIGILIGLVYQWKYCYLCKACERFTSLLSWSELDSAIIRSIKNKLRVGVEWSALNVRI